MVVPVARSSVQGDAAMALTQPIVVMAPTARKIIVGIPPGCLVIALSELSAE
jgi:hypothetical protein